MLRILTGKTLPSTNTSEGARCQLGASLSRLDVPCFRSPWTVCAQARIHRFQTFYVPNGMAMQYWSPTGEGRDFGLTPILEPLEPFKRSDVGSFGNQSELGPDPRRCFRIVPDWHSSGRADRD